MKTIRIIRTVRLIRLTKSIKSMRLKTAIIIKSIRFNNNNKNGKTVNLIY